MSWWIWHISPLYPEMRCFHRWQLLLHLETKCSGRLHGPFQSLWLLVVSVMAFRLKYCLMLNIVFYSERFFVFTWNCRWCEWHCFYISPTICNWRSRWTFAVFLFACSSQTANSDSITDIFGMKLFELKWPNIREKKDRNPNIDDKSFNFYFQLIISLVMLFTSNVFLLINYFSQILWLSVVASIAALLWLRKTK